MGPPNEVRELPGPSPRRFYVRSRRFDGLPCACPEVDAQTLILRETVLAGIIQRKRMPLVVVSNMGIERAIDLLQANDLSRVTEVHLMHRSDSNRHADQFRQLVARATGKPVYVAYVKAEAVLGWPRSILTPAKRSATRGRDPSSATPRVRTRPRAQRSKRAGGSSRSGLSASTRTGISKTPASRTALPG